MPECRQTWRKKPERERSGIQLVVARIKLEAFSRRERVSKGDEREPAAEILSAAKDLSQRDSQPRYAVLLGRTVRSRICARMLDICMPFNCDTNGRISAMN